MITALKDFIEWRKARRESAKDAAECFAVASAFNNRYTFRIPYDKKQIGWDGYRWMCPTCNKIHAPTEYSPFVGIMYPACCEYRSGERCTFGIKYQ